jgi:hypothetical protein
VPNLNRLRTKLQNHLKEFLPASYREMRHDGSLERYLDQRVDSWARQMETLRSSGMSEETAMEHAQAEFLPTPEPEKDEPVSRKALDELFGTQTAPD